MNNEKEEKDFERGLHSIKDLKVLMQDLEEYERQLSQCAMQLAMWTEQMQHPEEGQKSTH